MNLKSRDFICNTFNCLNKGNKRLRNKTSICMSFDCKILLTVLTANKISY
jgi:hypothetical protein